MPCRPVALNTFFWYFSRNCLFPLFEIVSHYWNSLCSPGWCQTCIVFHQRHQCRDSSSTCQHTLHVPRHPADCFLPGFQPLTFPLSLERRPPLVPPGGSFSQWQTLSACGLLKRVFISSSVLKAISFGCTIRVDFLLFLLQDFPEWSLVFGQAASLSSYASFIHVEPLSGLAGYTRLVSTSPAVWLCCM